MPTASDDVIESGLALPVDERQAVADRLAASVPGTRAEHRAAWAAEATRRTDDPDAKSLDLGTFLAELRADLRRIHRP